MSDAASLAPIPQVNCPTCGKSTPFVPENAWRPFCSERCKLIDLGAWAEERYRVPVVGTDSFDESSAT